MVSTLNRSLTRPLGAAARRLAPGAAARSNARGDGGGEGCRRAGVGENARDAVLDVGRRPTLPGRHDDQSGRHRLEDRDAELLLEARGDVDAARAHRSGRPKRAAASQVATVALGR